MATGRLEAFSDGVFAIAITLLILTVTPPTHGELGHELLRLWPSYVAYAVSFLTIGIIWVNHHAVFRLLAGVDRTMLFLNVFFFWLYGSRRLLREDCDPRDVSGISRSFAPGIPSYLVGTLLAFVSRIASLIVFAALACFYVLSNSLFARNVE